MNRASKHWQKMLQESDQLSQRLRQNPTALKKHVSKILAALEAQTFSSPYLNSLSDKKSPNLSPKLDKDAADSFVQWWTSKHHKPTFHLAFSRWYLRRTSHYLETGRHPSTQTSPILSIASELLGLVDEYADKLDRNIHLCFVLHAEGLDNKEISGVTNLAPNLVTLYIESAKELIKDHLKELIGKAS